MGIGQSEGIIRFEGFELNVRSAELRNPTGKTARLSEQPLRILIALLEHPGELVLREDLRKRLWPNDTVVEFEHSINAAVNRLRQVLGDSAVKPKFIETLARRGYRWKIPVQWEQLEATPTPQKRVDGNLIGKRVSHYRVLEILGGGGMGVVYKAEDIKLGRRVALKFLPEELADDAATMQRFEREARAASALNHPNICTIYAVEEHEGQPFLAMELLEGQTLRDMIAGDASPERKVALQLKLLLETAVRIAKGLEAAHQNGIIHRDIKPANIFVTNHGQVKILDFGLAKLHEFESVKTHSQVHADQTPTQEWNPLLTLTRTGVTVGTAAYMSPEQVRGEKLDQRTDLFSFGLVLYEMATKQRAFPGDTAALLHDAIVNQTPVPARNLNSQIPARLEAIISNAIEKDRSARYQTASEICADLERLQLASERRVRRWTLTAGIATVILASASFWWSHHNRQSVPSPPDLKLRQLTANSPENRVRDGRISPNGRYLAYVDVRGIHIKNIETDEIETLAQPEGLKKQKIEWALGGWAPDGTRLIANAHPPNGLEYLSEVEADKDLSIWEFLVPSGTPHLLRNSAWGDSFSPDGALISFRTNKGRTGAREIWLMGSNGDNAQKVFESDAAGGFGWSLDGSHVGYIRDTGSDLKPGESKWVSFPWVGDHIPEGSTPTDLSLPFGLDDTFDASELPGDRFIFSVGEGGSIGNPTCNFWTARRDPHSGKVVDKPRQLTHWTGFCMSEISVTKDGKRLAFLEWSGHPALYVADLQHGGSHIINERHFTESEGNEQWADWTPDSKSLIFWSNRSGHPAIYTQRLDEHVAEILVKPQEGLAAGCISPDGKWFLYVVHSQSSDPQNPSQMMRIPIAGGTPRVVMSTKNLYTWGCARKRRGACVLVERSEDGEAAFSTLDPITGRTSQLARIALDLKVENWAFGLSPDGERMALIRGQGNPLQILSLEGKVLQEIKIPAWGNAGLIDWAPDGKGLFVPILTENGASLLYVSLKGDVHVVRENRGGNYSPGLPSPDGRHIAIVGTATSGNMWMMQNF